MGDEIKVNDGGGLLDTTGLIDSLIVDCNTIVGKILTGSYIGFCAKAVDMVGKLTELKKGVAAELSEKDKIIADLKRFANDLSEQATGLPADRENEGGTSNV